MSENFHLPYLRLSLINESWSYNSHPNIKPQSLNNNSNVNNELMVSMTVISKLIKIVLVATWTVYVWLMYFFISNLSYGHFTSDFHGGYLVRFIEVCGVMGLAGFVLACYLIHLWWESNVY